MGRRRRRGDGGASLDSLMDTMTNVVGILIIVLIVTQLGVDSAVKRLAAALPDISQEDYDAALAEKQTLEDLLKNQDTDQIKSKIDADEAASQKLQKTIDDLKKQLKDRPKTNLDLSDLEKDLKKQEELARKKAKELDKANQRLALLKAQLDKLPAKPGKTHSFEIKLPDPRPAPKNAKKVSFIVRGGRIYRLSDDEYYRKIVLAQIKRANPGWKPGKPCKCQPVIKLFDDKALGDNSIRIKFRPPQYHSIRLEAKENPGESLEDIKSGKSKFETFVKGMNRRKEWLRINVWSEDYELYLTARQIADKYKVPTGWDVISTKAQYGSLGVSLKGIKCDDLKKPPTSNKPAPAAPKVPPPPDVKVKGSQID